MKKELIFQIGLTLIPKVGPVVAKKLIAYCGGVEAVFKEKQNLLQKIPNIGPVLAKSIANQTILKRAEEELLFIDKHQLQTDYYLEDNYPKRLKHCEDAPLLLFSKGKFDYNAKKVVSIVGTRSATSYGKKICQELVEELQSHGVLVVSGLSYGVDTCSHKSAIKNELATIGILAHGLDRIYPSANKNLAKKMMSNGGLVTEFLSQTNPDRENFVRRNRIVAGLSDATIVVESAMKGGALITADIANSYNREVFAVPGPLHSQYSEGCNHLIKTNRAVLLTGVKDLEYLLNWDKAEGKGKQVQLFDLTEEEQTLVEVVKKFDKLSVEELIFHSKLTRGKMAQLLLQLELKQVVRVLPGKIVALH